jgi:hypothetical protein
MTLYTVIATVEHHQEEGVVGTVPMKDSYTLKKAESVNLMNTIITQTRDDDVPSISSSTGEGERDKESLQESGSIYNWQAVLNQIRADPSLAKIAVDGVLPLHAACGDGASIDVIKFLLEEYPEAAQAKCDKGYLPIFWHLELNTKSPSEQVLLALLEAYPGAAAVVNPQNQLPIHLACKAHGMSEKIFATLLCANPEGAYVCDDNGKYPVDYAAANDDTATREVALSSLRADNIQHETLFKKSSKSAQDIAVGSAWSRSMSINTISKAGMGFFSCGIFPCCVQNDDDAEVHPDAVETVAEKQQPLLEVDKVLTNPEVAMETVAQSHSGSSIKSEASKKSSNLKSLSTPKSKSTLRKMKGFLTRKLKKVS